MATEIVDDWHGFYSESWRGVITPKAFQHPAKFSRALIRHIYGHLLVEGLIQAGDALPEIVEWPMWSGQKRRVVEMMLGGRAFLELPQDQEAAP